MPANDSARVLPELSTHATTRHTMLQRVTPTSRRSCVLPPACSAALALLHDVLPAVEVLVAQLPAGFFQPVRAQLAALDGGQMDVVREVDAALKHEYTIRRRMLIERIKVNRGAPVRLTVQGRSVQNRRC